MTETATELHRLATHLKLRLLPDGTPANPLVELPLDRWRDASEALTGRIANLIAGALPLTVGVLTGPPTPQLEEVMAAATLTIASQADGHATIVPADICGTPQATVAEPPGALHRLRAAVERSPRAAVACGQLLRQTAGSTVSAGLAAEAATYSMLLRGPEFARWLAGRGAPRQHLPPPEPLQVCREDGRLTIVLNDPARRNPFSASLREALIEILTVAGLDDSVQSVELRGAGAAFCSGGDLDEFGAATDIVSAYLVRLCRAPWRIIDAIAPKVTAFAHGACVGAGAELVAYAGRVVVAPDAYFVLPEVRMGLVPGAGGSVSVPRRIGRWRAAWLMLTGDRLSAETALRWGLADDIARIVG